MGVDDLECVDAEKNHLYGEDNLLKNLILENESKLLESHKKAARKQGLLRKEESPVGIIP